MLFRKITDYSPKQAFLWLRRLFSTRRQEKFLEKLSPVFDISIIVDGHLLRINLSIEARTARLFSVSLYFCLLLRGLSGMAISNGAGCTGRRPVE
jgi:hypothetical protein